MVETIGRLQWIGGDQIIIVLDLEHALCEVRHIGVEFVSRRDAASKQREQFALLNRLAGKHAASAFLFERSRTAFRIQMGNILTSHSFLSFW